MSIRYRLSQFIWASFFVAVGLLIGSLAPVQAQDLYVDASNACPGSGTQTEPYCEIQTAINNASAGDVIDVAEGTYAEEVNITEEVTLEGPNVGISPNDPNDPLTPNASRTSEAVVKPPNGSFAAFHIGVSNVTIDGFTLDGDSDNDGTADIGGGINNFEIIPGEGVGDFDGIYRQVTDFTVKNNIIQDFTGSGVFICNGSFGGFSGCTGNPDDAENGLTTGGIVTSNRLEGLAGNPDNGGAGRGIQMESDGIIETITDNVILTSTEDEQSQYGIQTGNQGKSDDASGLTIEISGNTVDVEDNAIWTNFHGDDGPEVEISDNTATATVPLRIQSMAANSGLITVSGGNVFTADKVSSPCCGGSGSFGGFALLVFNSEGPVEITGNTIIATDGDATPDESIRGITVFNAAVGSISSVSFETIEGSAVSVLDTGELNTLTNTTGMAQAGGFALDVRSGTTVGDVTNNDLSTSTGAGTDLISNGTSSPLNLSGNWWGSTDATEVATAAGTDEVDYSPFLDSGNDIDTGTSGFQGDFSVLNLDSNSPDAQSDTKLQEAVALGGSDNIILQTTGGTYDVPGNVDLPGRLTLANDGLDFSGSGTVSIANDELAVESGVTSIGNSANFELQNRFTGTNGSGDPNDMGWRILSAPRVGMTGADIGQTLAQASSGSILYTWDGSLQEFVQQDLTSSSNLPAGKGFFLYLFDESGRDQIDAGPSGTCQSGDACIRTDAELSFADPVSDAFGVANVDVGIPDKDNDTATEAGFVLGNPFAQSFDIQNLVVSSRSSGSLGDEGQFRANVQAWNPQTNNFQVINNDPNLSNTEVAPWQGFWVLRAAGGTISTETLTFESAGRTTGAPFIPSKATTNSSPESGQLFVTMEVEDNNGTVIATSDLSLYANENAVVGDDVYSAPRIKPPTDSYAQISFLNEDDVRQAQASLPYDLNDFVEIPLHAEGVGVGGTAEISTDPGAWENIPADWGVAIRDTDTNEIKQLSLGETYTFNLSDSGSSGDNLGSGPDGSTVANSRFVITAGPGGQLPVELSDFSGQADGQAAILSWTTASETNNAGFNVQQQTDTGSYETVQFVEGAGTTDAPQSYQLRLEDLSYGTHTFRLEQVDTDGAATASEPVEVQVQLQEAMAVTPVAPNPVRGQGTARVTVRETQPVQAVLYDALGRRVRTIYDGELQAQQPQALQVEASTLASGTYFLRVQGETAQHTTRFVVVR